MDQNLLRSIITVLSLLSFVGIVFWAYSSRRKDSLEAQGLIPFEDDDTDPRVLPSTSARQGS